MVITESTVLWAVKPHSSEKKRNISDKDVGNLWLTCTTFFFTIHYQIRGFHTGTNSTILWGNGHIVWKKADVNDSCIMTHTAVLLGLCLHFEDRGDMFFREGGVFFETYSIIATQP